MLLTEKAKWNKSSATLKGFIKGIKLEAQERFK